MKDTIDLIPIGAYYGKGSRAGLFGAYLMASYNM
jgi:DNA ligase-1